VGVGLHRVLLDQELDALVEGRRHRRWLLPQEHLDGIVARQAHDVVGASGMGAALAVRTIRHAV
jgi:hypothetical protein